MVDLKVDAIKKKVAAKARRDFSRMWREDWKMLMRFYGYKGKGNDYKTRL